jgi:DNA-binding NarL/FixJ family response regulator
VKALMVLAKFCLGDMKVPALEENAMKDTNILVVEDNPWTRRALTAFISSQKGMKVCGEASNGLETIDIIRHRIPDIVLMDIEMPVLDGLEATRMIKKYWPTIKVVILTMYPNYQADAFAAGADAFLVKSCPVDELISTIHALLRTVTPGEFQDQQDRIISSSLTPHIA